MNVLDQIQLLIENISITELPKIVDMIEFRKIRDTGIWLDNLPEEDEDISLEEELEVESILESIRNGESTFSWEETKLEIGIENHVEIGV